MLVADRTIFTKKQMLTAIHQQILLQRRDLKKCSLSLRRLETRLEQKGKELEDKPKIDLQAEKFKFRSNQKQFVFNAELEELVGKIKEANVQKDHKKVAQLTDQAKSLLHKRRKLIRLADSSEAGWDAVQ